jgi:hypothetical protein
MSVAVLMSADAQADFVDLPVTIQERVTAVVERLKTVAERIRRETDARWLGGPLPNPVRATGGCSSA